MNCPCNRYVWGWRRGKSVRCDGGSGLGTAEDGDGCIGECVQLEMMCKHEMGLEGGWVGDESDAM